MYIDVMEYAKLLREEHIFYSEAKSAPEESIPNGTFQWKKSIALLGIIGVIAISVYFGFYYNRVESNTLESYVVISFIFLYRKIQMLLSIHDHAGRC